MSEDRHIEAALNARPIESKVKEEKSTQLDKNNPNLKTLTDQALIEKFGSKIALIESLSTGGDPTEIAALFKELEDRVHFKKFSETHQMACVHLAALFAQKGYAPAQNILGLCYLKGIGVEKDAHKAVELFQQADKQKYLDAQNNLGFCYQQGSGVKKNDRTAFECFRLAAAQGYAPAQNNLGSFYSKGIHVKKDAKQAVQWYRQAAKQGYAPAENNLGNCYLKGDGVQKNINQALALFHSAAEKEYAAAQSNLGYCYQHGIGVEKDIKKAVALFQSAAELGSPGAQFSLGQCFEEEIGVEKNDNKAINCYRSAAANGSKDAEAKLKSKYFDQLTEIEEDKISELILQQRLATTPDRQKEIQFQIDKYINESINKEALKEKLLSSDDRTRELYQHPDLLQLPTALLDHIDYYTSLETEKKSLPADDKGNDQDLFSLMSKTFKSLFSTSKPEPPMVEKKRRLSQQVLQLPAPLRQALSGKMTINRKNT